MTECNVTPHVMLYIYTPIYSVIHVTHLYAIVQHNQRHGSSQKDRSCVANDEEDIDDTEDL